MHSVYQPIIANKLYMKQRFDCPTPIAGETLLDTWTHLVDIFVDKTTNNKELFFMMVARGAHSADRALYSCLPLSCDFKFRFKFARFGCKKLAPRPNSKPRYLESPNIEQRWHRNIGVIVDYDLRTQLNT